MVDGKARPVGGSLRNFQRAEPGGSVRARRTGHCTSRDHRPRVAIFRENAAYAAAGGGRYAYAACTCEAKGAVASIVVTVSRSSLLMSCIQLV
jgi:hypothetical protein